MVCCWNTSQRCPGTQLTPWKQLLPAVKQAKIQLFIYHALLKSHIPCVLYRCYCKEHVTYRHFPKTESLVKWDKTFRYLRAWEATKGVISLDENPQMSQNVPEITLQLPLKKIRCYFSHTTKGEGCNLSKIILNVYSMHWSSQ